MTTKPIRVQTTPEDVMYGSRLSCSACPVARATVRALQAAGVWVTGAKIAVGVSCLRIFLPATTGDAALWRGLASKLPIHVAGWIADFDAERIDPSDDPLSFVIELTPERDADPRLLAALLAEGAPANASA